MSLRGEKKTVNKLLKIEIAVLLVLVVVAVFIRIGTGGNDAPQTEPSGSITLSEPTGSTQSTPPTQASTLPSQTEPELELTFGPDFKLESTRDYFVYHCGLDKMLTNSANLDKKIYPASITKLFSAYVALQYLDPETVVTVGSEVNLVASDSSLAHVKKGQTIRVAELVEGMLLPSGNDAAYALAGAAARAESGDPDMPGSKALSRFVELMNLKAQELGLTGSHFSNPDGYHEADHYLSVTDLITVARLALETEVIRTYAKVFEDRVNFSTGEVAHWHNTNALVNPQSPYYCEDALGLKTGHTSQAGFCLLSAFEVEGEYIIIGAFGCQRPEDRFIDTLRLYDLVVDAMART